MRADVYLVQNGYAESRAEAQAAIAAGKVAVDGRPIHEASPERVKLLRSIALGRLRAASWLVGLHPLYSETPASIY